MTALVASACGLGAAVVGAVGASGLVRTRPSAVLPPRESWATTATLREWTALLGVLTGLAAALTAWSADAARRPAEVLVAVVLVVGAAADERSGRLPNVLVVPAGGLTVALLAVQDLVTPWAGSVTAALATAVTVAVVLTVAALVLPTRIGMGDARFVALACLVLAYPGQERVLVMCAGLAVLAAARYALALRRVEGALVPFGSLVAAATLGTLWVLP